MVTWYGERGALNAIVTYLDSNFLDTIDFLGRIRWAHGGQHAWVQQVTSIEFLVECKFSLFGDPDVILICNVAGERPRCVFLEGKVISFEASAKRNSRGMTHPGYNSSCNGQLSLRYRLAKALTAWNGHPNVLQEPEDLLTAYRRGWQDGGLSDSRTRPRMLCKRRLLQKLDDLGLARLPEDRCFFVALTWDRVPFFNLPTELLPKFCREDGEDAWADVSPRLGWLGYGLLETMHNLVKTFRPVIELMVPSLEPPAPVQNVTGLPALPVPGITIQHMAPRTQEVLHAALASAQAAFGNRSVNASDEAALSEQGSLSITVDRVVAKVVPVVDQGEESVWLGTRPDVPLADWAGIPAEPRKFCGQPFSFAKLPKDVLAASRILGAVFQQLSDVL